MQSVKLINLLIVDDNEAFCKTVEDILKEDHYSTLHATSIQQAQEYLTEYEIDAILCDQNLIGEKGTDFLKLLKKNGILVPVIIMSGDVTSELITECLRLGAYDIFQKPIQMNILIKTLNTAILMGIRIREIQYSVKEKMGLQAYAELLNMFRSVEKMRTLNPNLKK